MSWVFPAVLIVATFGAALLMTGALIGALKRRHVLDRPNERSSHTVPTPRGGGLAVMAALLPAIVVAAGVSAPEALPIVLIAVIAGLLAALSWADDIRGLSPLPRLAAHALAVGTALGLGAVEGPFFQGLLSPAADRLAAGLIWIWFINLFNFMDGIDGIAGVEAAAIGIGCGWLLTLSGSASALALSGFALGAAALGFLKWNWHPARIFLGDVGSIPLGFLLGWLLLSLAERGFWAAALVLPLYFFTDATVTLVKRLLQRKKVWQAHREHFYQRAVARGLSHAHVTAAVAVADVVLVIIAINAHGQGWPPIIAALIVVQSLIMFLIGGRRRGERRK